MKKPNIRPFEVIANEWMTTKAEEKRAWEHRISLEEEMLQNHFSAAQRDEGTVTLRRAGYKIVLRFGLIRTADLKAESSVWATLNQIPEECWPIKASWELNEARLREFEKSHALFVEGDVVSEQDIKNASYYRMLSEHIETKPAKTGVSIVREKD